MATGVIPAPGATPGSPGTEGPMPGQGSLRNVLGPTHLLDLSISSTAIATVLWIGVIPESSHSAQAVGISEATPNHPSRMPHLLSLLMPDAKDRVNMHLS